MYIFEGVSEELIKALPEDLSEDAIVVDFDSWPSDYVVVVDTGSLESIIDYANKSEDFSKLLTSCPLVLVLGPGQLLYNDVNRYLENPIFACVVPFDGVAHLSDALCDRQLTLDWFDLLTHRPSVDDPFERLTTRVEFTVDEFPYLSSELKDHVRSCRPCQLRLDAAASEKIRNSYRLHMGDMFGNLVDGEVEIHVIMMDMDPVVAASL